MSRSLGDAFSEDFGFIADPIIDVFQIQALKTRIAVKENNTSLKNSGGALYVACKDLIVKSSQLWARVSVGRGMQMYRDDISIAVRKI